MIKYNSKCIYRTHLRINLVLIPVRKIQRVEIWKMIIVHSRREIPETMIAFNHNDLFSW